MRFQLEVLVHRGPVLESRHELEAVLCDAAGTPLARTARPGLVTTFRSSAKPFQLLPLVERGHADRLGLRDEELAVMAASHTGSPRHLELVRGVLDRLGLGPEHLACGYHDPEDAGSLAEIRSGAAPRSPLYNNCSGKHAGMLALCRAEGWPLEGYFRPQHPLQQTILRTIAEVCDLVPESIPIAIDGCSLVVFALPLQVMARAYATLAVAARASGGDARTQALGRIARAMTSHPRVVEGGARVSTAIMEATAGRLLAKGGAEGLQLVALTDRAQGLAIKCVDGAQRAVGPATFAVLEHLEALSDAEQQGLAAVRRTVLRNAAGLEVGQVTAELRATAVA